MSYALKAARHFVHPETGYVHYHPQALAPFVTIPTFENLCYVLALFKTKEKEEVEKGIELLSKLLHFQNKEGYFPLYLHEYPAARDQLAGFNHLKPLLEIEKFSSVIPFRDKLRKSIQDLTEALRSFLKEKKPAAFNAYLLSKLIKEGDVPLEFSRGMGSSELAERLMNKESSEWLPLIWHAPSKRYVGPAFREKEEGYESEITLLPLLFNEKPAKATAAAIHSALINEYLPEPSFKPFKMEDTIEGYRFGIWQEKDFAISCLDKRADYPQFYQPGCKLLQIIIGPHTIVLEGKTGHSTRFEWVENGVDIFIQMKAEMELDDKEKQREINLYFDDRIPIRPSHKEASLFYFDEPIALLSPKPITLTFSVAEGKGDFVCHVMNENRSSQKQTSQPFDKAIGVRTLRRDPHTVIKASFRL